MSTRVHKLIKEILGEYLLYCNIFDCEFYKKHHDQPCQNNCPVLSLYTN